MSRRNLNAYISVVT